MGQRAWSGKTRSNCPQMFFKIGVRGSTTLLKRDSSTGVSLWILKSNNFYITPPLPASVICRTFKVSRSFLGENPRKTWNEVIKSDLKKSKVSDDLAKDRFMIMKALYPSSPGDSNQINMIRRQLFFQNKIPQALTWC